jgi:hypothetical protein
MPGTDPSAASGGEEAWVDVWEDSGSEEIVLLRTTPPTKKAQRSPDAVDKQSPEAVSVSDGEAESVESDEEDEIVVGQPGVYKVENVLKKRIRGKVSALFTRTLRHSTNHFWCLGNRVSREMGGMYIAVTCRFRN